MGIFQSIFLGIVQGLTEFLPVSSSGHLVLTRHFFGFDTYTYGLFFDTLLHVGTLISVFIIFRKDVKELIVEFFGLIGDICKRKKNIIKGKPYRRMLIMLIISTLPVVIAALIIGTEAIERAFQNTLLVGIALLVTGTFLFFSSKLPRGNDDANTSKFRSALWVGLAQVLAIIPGISRSGSTIVAGEATGMTRQFAAKFSFLMSIIAIIGGTVMQIPSVDASEIVGNYLPYYIIGIAAAAISGIIAIKFMLKLINKGKFHYFAYYCWAIGTIAVISHIVNIGGN